jgi:hypothetical protein
MTKKDYMEVAQVIRRRRTAYSDVPSTISVQGQQLLESAVLVVDETTRDLADLFQKENPHFDRDRFLIGAGVPR